MKSNVSGLSLPKNWPKRVKMAVLHVISLAHVAIVHARGLAVNNHDARTRRAGDLQGALDEIALLEEELRIKDARMAMIDAHRRPYFRPIERMAILELKAARGWSQAEAARRFLVKPTTIASWLKRIDESSKAPLVQIGEPVNKFPDLVRYLVRKLSGALPGSQAEGAISVHGPKADCSDVGASRAPFECEHGGSHAEVSRSRSGVFHED